MTMMLKPRIKCGAVFVSLASAVCVLSRKRSSSSRRRRMFSSSESVFGGGCCWVGELGSNLKKGNSSSNQRIKRDGKRVSFFLARYSQLLAAVLPKK
jgi:hypothetical protein